MCGVSKEWGARCLPVYLCVVVVVAVCVVIVAVCVLLNVPDLPPPSFFAPLVAGLCTACEPDFH